jgi:anionic cell wall polymer biosynthesis LytR-Cps2A-Psr (LCP) family protein
MADESSSQAGSPGSNEPSGQPWHGSPVVAAVASFAIPGLGQVLAGRRTRGVIVAIPMLVVIAAIVFIAIFARHDILNALSQNGLEGLLVFDVALFAYRVWAMFDAYAVAGGSLAGAMRSRQPLRLAGVAVVAVLLVTDVGIHGVVATDITSIQQSLGCMANPDGPICQMGPLAYQTIPPDFSMAPIASGDLTDNGPTPSPTDTTGASGTPSDTPSPSPTATPAPVVYVLGDLPQNTGSAADWAADGYLNVLLIGADQGPGGGRMSGLRPDSMMLLEVNIKTGQAAMYGVPRNLINVPLPAASAKYYGCHCYGPSPGTNQVAANYLIDYLWQEAAVIHPQYYSQYGTGRTWAASYVRGVDALKGAVGALAGVTVDGAVVINLPGFVKLVNTIAPNGLTVDVPYEVKEYPKGTKGIPGYEPANGGPDIWGIDIKAGTQIMSGDVALEYARMRHAVGYDSDYYRMRRQQIVLKAVRAQLDPCTLLPNIPTVMSALTGALWTDLPVSAIPQLAALAEHIGTANIASYSLDPTTTGAAYDVLDQTSVNKVRNIVAHGLDSVPAGLTGGSGGGGGLSC